MKMTTAADGTSIAFDTFGSGDPVVLVLGAFNRREAGEPLARRLAQHRTAIVYDRRGRGDSGDAASYSPEREIEDLAALIDEAGGSAAVLGYSSGAVLAMLAAAAGVPITRLALYEPPIPMAGRGPAFWRELARDIETELGAGRRGGAVELFQTRAIGIPEEIVAQLRHAPFRPQLEELAHTLRYEALVLGAEAEPASRVTVPALVLVGEQSPPPMRDAAASTARMLVAGRLEVLPGQGHEIVPDAVGPVLLDFYR